MMQQIIKTFPDDKPITSICVIEDVSKKPGGFSIVSKTHDHDSDADLWKGYTFFGNRISRYLCISKTEGIDNYIVEDIGIIGEKDMPPDGYGLIPKTMDTDAKAWKKRQICYKLSRRNLALCAVTDIILLSKSKKAPEGFNLAGDINGLAVCFKTIHDLGQHNNNPPPSLGYSLNPKGTPGNKTTNGLYPNMVSPSGEYVNLLRPKRPAPTPPVSPQSSSSLPPVPPRSPLPVVTSVNASSYSTLKVHEGVEGVPFVLHPALELIATRGASIGHIPVIKKKTLEELDREETGKMSQRSSVANSEEVVSDDTRQSTTSHRSAVESLWEDALEGNLDDVIQVIEKRRKHNKYFMVDSEQLKFRLRKSNNLTLSEHIKNALHTVHEKLTEGIVPNDYVGLFFFTLEDAADGFL